MSITQKESTGFLSFVFLYEKIVYIDFRIQSKWSTIIVP